MPVTAEQLKKLLEKPGNRHEIAEAKRREELIRFHSETSFETYESPYALSDFLDQFLREVVTNYDQYRLYKLMLQFPVDTNPLLSEIYGALWKIFEGKDPVYNASFLTPTMGDDWMEYRNDWKLDEFWRHRSWEEFKCYSESFVVVDLPDKQSGSRPEPYPYFLRISNVWDYKELNNPGEWEELEYIIFRVDRTRVAFFDTEVYQLFSTEDDSDEIGVLIASIPHNLGYCPVTKLVHGEHPVSMYLTKLKKLLFSYLGQDITDFSIANPVWWVYEKDCDFEDPNTHVRCDGGFLRQESGDYILSGDRKLERCPKCQGKFRGHGTVIELPAPNDDQKGLGTPPAGVIVTPVDSLEYGSSRVRQREDAIYKGLVGTNSTPPNDKAVNEKQVRALQESTEDKLTKLQKTFERAQQRTEETICRLRYGAGFVSMSISYGQTHYIDKPGDVLANYETSRKNGDSDTILDGIYEHYMLLKYRNNQEQLQYQHILWNLEPYRHRTISEVREMYRNFEVEFVDYYIKSNFSSLVAKFERENISVIEFGSALEFDKKIDAIYQTLISYANAIQANTEKKRQEAISAPKA